MKTNAAQDNKTIKRLRVMRYFMDATREIINEEGMGAVNIRSVSNRAGYNSASLYNYFENLDHLIAFTCIDMLSDWLKELARIETLDLDPLDRYIMGWDDFCKHSFSEPTAYQYVYGTGQPLNVIHYFDSYMSAFSNAFDDIPELLMEMFRACTIEEQESIMIRPCIEAGFFDEAAAKEIWTLAHVLNNGILPMVIADGDQADLEKYRRMFMSYFVVFIQSRLCREKDLSYYQK